MKLSVKSIGALALAVSMSAVQSAHGLTITGTFTANFVADFGANAVAAENAWNAAAAVFTSNFSDNIHINITVDGVAGTGVFGQSSTFLNSFSYAQLQAAAVADAKTATDFTATGAGGSIVAADPVAGNHTWWVSTAQAKALGLIADNLSNDGTTTFGAGNPFSFSGTPGAGQYDFQGVAAHEISEVMGRLGLSGGTIGSNPNSYSLMDDFSYTAPGTKALGAGPNEQFSINNGTSLLKLYNDATQNNLDTRDWAPGTNDSFNQFSNPGVVNPVSAVDLEVMDSIGYDQVGSPSVPDAGSTLAMLGLSLTGLAAVRRKLSVA